MSDSGTISHIMLSGLLIDSVSDSGTTTNIVRVIGSHGNKRAKGWLECYYNKSVIKDNSVHSCWFPVTVTY